MLLSIVYVSYFMKSADDFLTEKKTDITQYIISSNEMFKDVQRKQLEIRVEVYRSKRRQQYDLFLFIRIF